jgi:hypothetical protein
MRHLTLVRSAALAATISLFSACGSDSTGPDFDDTFNGEDAFYVALGVVSTAEQGMQTMHWGGPNVELDLAPAFLTSSRRPPHASHPSRLPKPVRGGTVGAYLSSLQSAAPGCSVSGSGANGDPYTPYDGNENEVPDDYSITIQCTDVDSVGEGVTVTYNERAEFRVKERTDILFGWDASLKQTWSSKRSDGADNDTEEENFSEKLEVTHERAKYSQNGFWHEKGMDGTEPYDSENGGDLTLLFTAGETPINLNTLFPPGTATLTGRFYMTYIDGPNLDWRIQTDRELVWDPECADFSGQPFTHGRIAALLNGDHAKAIELTANECDYGWSFAAYGGEDEDIPITRRPGAFSAPRR